MNAPISATPSEHVLPATWKLLRMRWRITFSSFKRANLKRKITLLFVWLAILAGIVFIFGTSWAILRFLQSPNLQRVVGDMAQLLNAVPIFIISASFFGILLTSFGVLLQGLYLAGDMEFLLSSPIPIRSVFLSKLLQAILPNLGIIALFALPILYGMGVANGYNFLYFPFVLIILAVFALAAAGISAFLVMLLVRIIPPRRIAEVLGFVGAILAMGMSQIGNILNFGEINPGNEQIQETLSTVERINTIWNPMTWGGRGLIALGNENWLVAIGLLILTISISLGIFWLSLVTAERWFYTGWAGMQVISQKKKTSRRRFSKSKKGTHRLLGWISPQIRAIIRKDWLVLRRDLRNLSQLVTPLIFGVIYTFMLLRNSGDAPIEAGEAPNLFIQAMKIALIYSSVGIAIFVGWMLLARLATMSFSQEHHSFWMLKSAPVSVRQLLTAKFIVAYLPALALGWAFLSVIILLQRAALGTWIYGLFVVAFCYAGLAGINLAFGVTGARFDWKDPRRMATTSTGCLSSLFSLIYLVINLFLFFGPPILFAAVGQSETAGQVLGGQFGGIMSLICALAPPWIVMKRVPRLAENEQD